MSKEAKKNAIQEEQAPHIATAIGLVAQQNFSDATNIVNELLSRRVVAALDEYKQTVAKNLFAPSIELSEEKEDDKEDDEKDEKDEKDEDEKDEKGDDKEDDEKDEKDEKK